MTTATLGPYAGINFPYSNLPPPRSFARNRNYGGTYGRKLTDWSAAPSNSSGPFQFSGDLPPYADNATRSIQLYQSSGLSFVQSTTLIANYSPSSSSTITAGAWVKNPGNKSLNFQLRLFNAAGSNVISWNACCDPGDWRFLTFSTNQAAVNTFVYGTDQIQNSRVTQQDALNEPAWNPGESLLIGNIYADVRGRAAFLISNDDGTDTFLNPVSTISGMPVSGRSYKDITEYYGFKGTLFISPAFVGTTVGATTYLTWTQIKAAIDSGWSVGSHSYSHPNDASFRGLTLLGPVGVALGPANAYYSRARSDDTAIYDDCARGLDAIRGLNIPNPEKLFALPSGAWDTYVRSALIRLGVSWVRGVGPSTPTNVHTLSIGSPSGAGTNNSSNQIPGGWIAQIDAVQTDGSPTLAQVKTYIDDCILQGAVGSNYHHGITAANAIIFDGMCSYLREKADAGLIDVMTGDEFIYAAGY
jgi:Polysaccharide deacetylase